MDKHTPGPWIYAAPDDLEKDKEENGFDWPIEIVQEADQVGVLARVETIADARLIAAAPDLLNALEIALATIERLERHAPGTAKGTRDVVNTAIAKARG